MTKDRLKHFFTGLVAEEVELAIDKDGMNRIEQEFDAYTPQEFYKEIYHEISAIDDKDKELEERISGLGVLLQGFIDYKLKEAKNE